MLTRALAPLTFAALALLTIMTMSREAAAQERWGAIAPKLENSSNVVWATSKEQA
jgi:hypothetical protein